MEAEMEKIRRKLHEREQQSEKAREAFVKEKKLLKKELNEAER